MILKQINQDIWRGSRPETTEDYAAIGIRGINSLLSLDGENTDCNIKCEVLNWGTILPPSKSDLEIGLRIINVLPKPVFIHCQSGVDRTGMMIAYYKIKNGLPVSLAIKDMWANGMHFWFFYWALYLKFI